MNEAKKLYVYYVNRGKFRMMAVNVRECPKTYIVLDDWMNTPPGLNTRIEKERVGGLWDSYYSLVVLAEPNDELARELLTGLYQKNIDGLNKRIANEKRLMEIVSGNVYKEGDE